MRSQTRYGGGYTAESVVWLDYVWPTAGGSTTVDYQVGASSSDSHMTSITNDSGRAPTLSGAVSLTNAILSPGSHGNNDEWSVAARFSGVAVAQGATISSATFQMRCQNTWNAAPNVIKYYVSAEASDNAAALSATSGDLNTTARPRSTATTIVDWTSLTVDTWYSVDITAIVQEIVNRAGWSSGNAIVILVDTHADTTLSEWQDFYAYDGAAASAPKLSITYASGGGPTDYPRSITSTNALTALFGRAVVVTRTETYAASHALTVARSQVAIRTASRTNAHAATLARAQGLTRTESATDAHAATVARAATAGRTASTSAAHTAQVSRVGAFVRALSTSISHAVNVARSVTPGGGSNYPRDIASTLSHAASIVRALTATRTATTTDSHAASVTRTGQYTRTASRTNAHAATVARSTGVLRGLAASWGVSTALSRALVTTRTLAASVGRSDAISRAAAFGRSVAASLSRYETVTRAGTFARGLAQAWSAAVTVAATVTGALFGVDPGGRRLTGAGGRVATEAARMFARLVRGRSVGGRRGTTGAGSRGTTETDG